MDSYTIPTFFLPASSDLPILSEVSPTLRCAMGQSIDATDKLLVQLGSHIQISSWMCSTLLPFSETLGGMAQMLMSERQSLQDQAVSDLNGESLQIATADISKPMAEAYTIYDDYFCMVRVSSMAQLQFTAQVVSTCQNVLHDLPYTLLERTQLTVLIHSMAQMLRVLAANDMPSNINVDAISNNSAYAWPQNATNSDNTDNNATNSDATNNDSTDSRYANQQQTLYAESWQNNVTEQECWTEKVAYHRWKVGHHFFNLCTIFCRHALQQAQKAIVEERLDVGAKQLQNAAQFLRGTTAAMWYASDFPASVYQTIIRPSMVMPGSNAGFSGDQNADYNRMKEQKEELRVFINAHYGSNRTSMPAFLFQAVQEFHEADVQDVEHHVLIAANKVGADQSLAQKEWMAELPTGAYHAQTAVDILREMAQMRRQDMWF